MAGVDGAGGPGAPARNLKADLEFTDLTYRSPIAAALLGNGAVFSAEANVDRDFIRWTEIIARMRSGAVDLSATDGSLDGAARSGSLTLDAVVADLFRAGRATGLSLSGAARSRAQISFEKDSINTTLSVAGERLAFGDRFLDALIGSRPKLRAVVNRSPAGTIVVRDLRVDAAALTGGGKADLDPRRDRIAAEFDIQTGDLATLTSLAGIEIGGRATMTVTAKGRLLDPDVTASLRVPAPRFASRKLAPLAIDLETKTAISNPTGKLLARYQAPEARIDASLGFALARPDKFRLHDIVLRGLGSEVTGSLDVPLDGAPIEGKLTGAIPNLAIIPPLLARRLEGAVSAEAVLGSSAGRQTATFRIAGTRLAAGSDIAAEAVTCSGKMQGLTPDGPLEANCRAKDIRVHEWRAKRASVSTVGTLSNAEVRVGATGEKPLAHRVDALARVEKSDEILKIALEKLVGEAGGQPVELSAPARIDIAPASMSITPAKFRVGRGELDVSAKMADGTVSGDLRLKGVELSDYAAIHARPGLSGQIDATMSLRGASANPKAAFAVRVSRLSLAADAGTKSPLMEGRIDGGIVDGAVSVEAMLTGFAETGLRAMGKAPVRFSLAPFELRPVDSGPIQAEMRWSGKLEPLIELFPIPGHSISGDASVSLDVTGTFKRPIATGSLRLREGRYENLFTGMVLTGVEFDGQGDTDRIRLRITGGGDDESSRLDGSGAVTLDRERGFPLDLKVSFTELAAVRRDDVSAVVNGRLSLTGGLDDLVLRGDIETRRVEWQIGQPLPPGVIDVDVTEIGGSKSTKPQQHENFSRNPGLRLDLDVRMPGNAFVRGRGLDSEWRGAVKVSGSTATPSVLGKLERVRGQFEFAGNAFKLVHGVVTFPRGKEIDPLINLRAEHTAKSLKATVAVTGKLSRPVIALSSVPQMPRDEILSRVIFGKGVGQLSRLEAAQLAVALASVTGLDGGGGLIDTLRRSVGVDVLRVGADQAGSPTAVVGKNISDELYVGVEQGAESNSGKVQVELEVLPGIKLKSGVTAETQGNIGVEFRWDY